jgi:hypothetical protein
MYDIGVMHENAGIDAVLVSNILARTVHSFVLIGYVFIIYIII